MSADTEQPAPMKIAIVGFTPTRLEAPFDDDDWQCWGMNDLHLQPDVDVSKFDAWYDLHDDATIENRPDHLRWLEAGSGNLPTFVWQPRESWPMSRRFPRDEIMSVFGTYFTNSVSWMVAHAIALIMSGRAPDQRAPAGSEIAVYGIDMAQSGEYAHQRPSCEYFLGMAIGYGIDVSLPAASDLTKTASVYGMPGGDALRVKLEQRRRELQERLRQHEQAMQEQRDAVMQLRGAQENNDYIMGVWVPPVGINRAEQPGSSELVPVDSKPSS